MNGFQRLCKNWVKECPRNRYRGCLWGGPGAEFMPEEVLISFCTIWSLQSTRLVSPIQNFLKMKIFAKKTEVILKSEKPRGKPEGKAQKVLLPPRGDKTWGLACPLRASAHHSHPRTQLVHTDFAQQDLLHLTQNYPEVGSGFFPEMKAVWPREGLQQT